MAITIKPVEAHDIETLTQLARTTFIETYQEVDDPVYLQNHVDRNHTVAVIEKEFCDPRNHFFIARVNDQPVGFCKLVSDENEANPALTNSKCIEIERMYILKAFQGCHIGHALLSESLNFAAQHHFEIIWLGVSQVNERAIKIYEQWGFTYFDTHLFDFGGEMQTDLLMKRPIRLHSETEQLINTL